MNKLDKLRAELDDTFLIVESLRSDIEDLVFPIIKILEGTGPIYTITNISKTSKTYRVETVSYSNRDCWKDHYIPIHVMDADDPLDAAMVIFKSSLEDKETQEIKEQQRIRQEIQRLQGLLNE